MLKVRVTFYGLAHRRADSELSKLVNSRRGNSMPQNG